MYLDFIKNQTLSDMCTTSKAVVEIFSLNDGKVKLLNLESVRRIIVRERGGRTIIFSLDVGIEDNWPEQVKSNHS
jgi:hypothetical protein